MFLHRGVRGSVVTVVSRLSGQAFVSVPAPESLQRFLELPLFCFCSLLRAGGSDPLPPDVQALTHFPV